ncbi:DUF4339 domain-containing protein [Rubritalea tangerina]|uniref:DUF4339 domain-containing protein n=1 Tax=Rubritalea tangerina TaxID=430798 RepID=UPI00361004D5
MWFYNFAGVRRGPISEDQMRALIVDRKLNLNTTLVWREGLSNWLPLVECPEFKPSVDLIHRLIKQEQQARPSSDELTLQKILDQRRGKRPSSLQTKLPYFWISVRVALSGITISNTIDRNGMDEWSE